VAAGNRILQEKETDGPSASRLELVWHRDGVRRKKGDTFPGCHQTIRGCYRNKEKVREKGEVVCIQVGKCKEFLPCKDRKYK